MIRFRHKNGETDVIIYKTTVNVLRKGPFSTFKLGVQNLKDMWPDKTHKGILDMYRSDRGFIEMSFNLYIAKL